MQYPDQNIRWSPEHQLHLTLAFLGEQPNSVLEPLCEALCQIDTLPFNLTTDQAGCFHHGALWLGIQKNPELMSLQQKIMFCLQRNRIQVEKRRYHPHITLGRCRINPAEAVEALQARLDQQQFCFQVDRFILKSSRLSPEGAQHTTEAEFILE